MSDSTRTILWIVAALVIVALVVWYFVRSARKRRELEARRFDAQSLRASADDRTPEVRSQADRASVTEQIAADARTEAQQKAREAEELEARAAEDQRRTEEAEREQAELRREADRIDPDIKTDESGNRVEVDKRAEAGTVAGSAAATGAGVAAGVTGYRDDEEPDLADHENPFADQPDQADQPGEVDQPDGGSHQPVEVTSDADWVNGPADEEADLDETAEADAAAADWINGPSAGEVTTDSAGRGAEPADDDFGAVGEVPHMEAVDVARASARASLPPSADMLAYAGAADGVMADDDDDEAGGDHEAPARADEGRSDGPVAEPDDLEEGSGRGQGDPFLSDAAAVARREISRYDEVRDGGYGVGSAAPIGDGVQPLGHPVKAWRASMTFAVPGRTGYDQDDPDVWFYDESAARRAGFHALRD